MQVEKATEKPIYQEGDFMLKDMKGKERDTSAAASANISAVPPDYNAPSNSTATHGSNVTPGSSVRSVSAVTPVDNVPAGANLVQGTNTVKKRVITIKTTVKNIWKPSHIPALHDLVKVTNMIVTNTFAFLKYVFIQELESSENFDLENFINKRFFVEVFLSLVDKQVCGGALSGKSRLTDYMKRYRQFIAKHKDNYIKYADYTPPKLVNAQQIALYECKKIETAYLNSIKAHFGNRLSMFLNKLCGKKEKAYDLKKKLEAEGCSKDLIKEKVREAVYKPCNQIKLAIVKKEMSETYALDNISKIKLQTFLSIYGTDYKFQKDSIYYDVKARLEIILRLFSGSTVLRGAEIKKF
ncbi:hypothetical protein EDC94DRAFT_132528 [Helicostylum pulchrum]|nr:hypothetical protein EDC94DRAFT_132528 [Helicostylum pulchrum]